MNDLDRKLATIQQSVAQLVGQYDALQRQVGRMNTPSSAGGYWVSMSQGLTPPPYSVTTSGWRLTIPRDLTLRAVVFTLKVNTTNDGSNYWSFTLEDTLGGSAFAAVDTALDTAGAFVQKNITTFTTAEWVAATSMAFFLKATMVGSPGTLDVLTPMLFFI